MSNNMDNNWIEAIKKKADQATREVPQGTWEAISNSLPQQSSRSIKRGAIAPRLWKAIAAAACVAIAVTTGLIFINDNEQSQPQQFSQQPQKQPKELTAKADNTVDTIQNDSTPTSANPIIPNLAQTTRASSSQAVKSSTTPSSQVKSKPSVATPEDNYLAHGQQESDEEEYFEYYDDFEEEYAEFDPNEYFYDIETMQALEELYAEYDDAMNQEAMEPWKSYSDSTYKQHLVYDANARSDARRKMALHKNKPKAPTFLMAAYGDGLLSSDRDGIVNSSSSLYLAPAAGNNPSMMMAPAAPGIPKVTPPVNYHYHHHMPITVGLTFSKRIVKNLYGNIGFNFTSMSSDVTPDNGTPEFNQSIKLVGVPFGVKWNFWRYRGLSTFVGGEGLVERVVSAKFNNESVTIKRLQWSIHATAGVQYNFTRNLGIYIEPKLSHYITTMPLNTQRNEHPLNFNLQMGISLDF